MYTIETFVWFIPKSYFIVLFESLYRLRFAALKPIPIHSAGLHTTTVDLYLCILNNDHISVLRLGSPMFSQVEPMHLVVLRHLRNWRNLKKLAASLKKNVLGFHSGFSPIRGSLGAPSLIRFLFVSDAVGAANEIIISLMALSPKVASCKLAKYRTRLLFW